MPDFCAENRRSSQIRQRNRVNGRSEGNASLPFVGFAAVRSVRIQEPLLMNSQTPRTIHLIAPSGYCHNRAAAALACSGWRLQAIR